MHLSFTDVHPLLVVMVCRAEGLEMSPQWIGMQCTEMPVACGSVLHWGTVLKAVVICCERK